MKQLLQNKKAKSIYSIWALIHLFLYINGNGNQYYYAADFYPFYKSNISGLGISFAHSEVYGFLELFIYLALPIVGAYTYFAFKDTNPTE